MKVRVLALVATVLLGATMIGASAFTTATLERDTTIDVVSDQNGIIGLVDGDSGNLVYEDGSTGELKIDFTNACAGCGANVDSRYEIGTTGWSSASSDEEAFNITNQDSVSHSITLNYTVSSGAGDANSYNETEFQVYDSTGSRVLTISEEDSGRSFTAGSGESYAVVVIIDTRHANIDQNDDLSGTLNVTAM